jgi:hypothetical protein
MSRLIVRPSAELDIQDAADWYEDEEQMIYKNEFYRMSRRAAMLCVLVLCLAGAGMTGACGSSEPVLPGSCSMPPDTAADEPTTCPAPVEKPCMRYHIQLDGNPSTDVALRSKYIAAFGSACYLSEAGTFDCFYKKWQAACADAVKIAEVYGAAPFDKTYTCQPVVGTADYSLQVGSDVANKIFINYQAAPRETPLIEVSGVPTEVSGPYRDLTEPQDVAPGEDFYCKTGQIGADGKSLNQRDWIIEVNRKKNGDKLRSDLAGLVYKCGQDANCIDMFCTEIGDLKEGNQYAPDAPEVHHLVRRIDQRGCSWGTNSNKNAAVVSRKLNGYLRNNYPSEDEVTQINKLPSYAP